MTSFWMTVALVLTLAGLAAAQTQSTTTTTATTEQDEAHQKTVTRTTTGEVSKPVKITPAIVRSVQRELAKRGYYKGRANGVYGARTRAAVRKFQEAENLPVTGYLDNNTLAKLNVGGTSMISSAPGDLGRGGKALGHDVKEGHPVDGAKAMGKGAEGFGKKVAKGSEALGKKGVEKVGQGISGVGNKVEGKAEGGSTQSNPPSNTPPKQ